MGRYRDRTFTGCWTCRSRRVKCDEVKPSCSACTRLGLSCEGYLPKLVWVDNNGLAYRSDGRMFLRCDLTWNGCPTLSSETLDSLIAECDESVSCVPSSFSRTQLLEDILHNPFSVFPLGEPHIQHDSSFVQDSVIPRMVAENPDLTWNERFLFHHYISQVAYLMMPYEHPRSPWISLYPTIALQGTGTSAKALYHSLIAHSAFNVARLRDQDQDISKVGFKSYASAIQNLLPDMNRQTDDFALKFAAIMTFVMAETYLGQTKTWRCHMKGAWTLLQHYGNDPRTVADFTCVSIQTLNIIKILGDTATLPLERSEYSKDISPSHSKDTLTSSLISSTHEFGFTLGAPKEILECISMITALGTRLSEEKSHEYFESDLVQILSKLSVCEQAVPNSEGGGFVMHPQGGSPLATALDVQAQKMAFVSATYIYLYRTIFALPPARLKLYVSRTFQHVSGFFKSSERNFSAWPAFIAAVEAYTEEDVDSAKLWLDRSTSFGMGNRDALRRIIEEVWCKRAEMAETLCLDPGKVTIDWRQIMQQMKCDVLLI